MLSIVIPAYNEQESLQELMLEIEKTMASCSTEFEVIFIDDGSTDGSWDVIRKLSDESEHVHGIRFRRNFGKAAALTAGMENSRGELIMMMDADLQDDPAEIPKFMARIEEGFDVVNGWKQRRLDPWHKVYPSKIFNWMVSTLTGLKLHDHNCGIKMFRRDVAEEITIYGELHRFIAVLAHAKGFQVTEQSVHHRARQFGHSKYGVRRFLRGFLDLLTVAFLTGFGQRPQHLLGGIGIASFLIGAAGLSYLLVIWCLMNVLGVLDQTPIGNRPLLLYSVAALLLGAQAISLGLIAELVVAKTTRGEATYSVAEATDLNTTSEYSS